MKRIKMIICFIAFFAILACLENSVKAEGEGVLLNNEELQENQKINIIPEIKKKDRELGYQGYTKSYSLIINKAGLYRFYINFSSDNDDDMLGGIKISKKLSNEEVFYEDVVYCCKKGKQYAEYMYYLESGEYSLNYILWDFNRDGFGIANSLFCLKMDSFFKGEVSQIVDNGYIQYKIMENPVIKDNQLIKKGKIEIISINGMYKKISIVSTSGDIEMSNTNTNISIRLAYYDVFGIDENIFEKTRSKITELNIKLGSYGFNKKGEYVVLEYGKNISPKILKGMGKLETFSIQGVKKLPKDLFKYAKKLTSIGISANKIPKGLFKYTRKVTSISIEANKIPKGLCKNLSELNRIGISCNNIPDNICNGCKNLTQVDLLFVRKIGKKAFYGTENLKSLSINLFNTGVLKSIGKKAFFTRKNRKGKIQIDTLGKKNMKRIRAFSKKAGLKKDDYYFAG